LAIITKVFVVNWFQLHQKLQHLFRAALYGLIFVLHEGALHCSIGLIDHATENRNVFKIELQC